MDASGPWIRSWTLWRRVGPKSGLGHYGGGWVPSPVLDAMDASGPWIRSWTLWRRVGPRSGLGHYGDGWVSGPVLDAVEARVSRSDLGRHGGGWVPSPVLDSMEAGGSQVRFWTLWGRLGPRSGLGRYGGGWVPRPVLDSMGRLGPRSGLGRYGGEKTIDLCRQPNSSPLNHADRSLVTVSTELSRLSAATVVPLLQNVPVGKSNV